MSINQAIIFVCDVCGERHVCDHAIHPEARTFVPSPPEGWRTVDGKVYCPKHEVQVVVLTPDNPDESMATVVRLLRETQSRMTLRQSVRRDSDDDDDSVAYRWR